MGATCQACGIGFGLPGFASPAEQRSHFKTDWHRYNVRRRVAKQPAVTEAQFEQLLENGSEVRAGACVCLHACGHVRSCACGHVRGRVSSCAWARARALACVRVRLAHREAPDAAVHTRARTAPQALALLAATVLAAAVRACVCAGVQHFRVQQ